MSESILFPVSILMITQGLIVSLFLLKIIQLSSYQFLQFLYIPSGKSSTNARLLGGLAISMAVLSGILFLFFYPESISSTEKETLWFASLSILIITIFGYIDDKHEIRARYKLLFQITAILVFSFLNAKNASSENPTLALIISTIFGLAFINGANLLDGLDTLSIKLGSVTSLAFLYLGLISNSSATVYLSLIHLSAFSMFYFYNREPAKIYMGEIGGSIVGLIFFIQSSLCFPLLNVRMGAIDAFSILLIAGSLPLCELGISFLRRIWCKKSPFRGDRLHLHYILKSKYKLSASETSTKMSKISAIILYIGLLAAQSYSSYIALAIVLATIIHLYLTVCMNEWRANARKESTKNVFDLLRGKTIHIVDSSKFNSIHVSVNEKKKAA